MVNLVFSEATIDLIKTLLATQFDKTQTATREMQKTTEMELETQRKEAEQRLAEHEQRRQDANSQLVGKVFEFDDENIEFAKTCRFLYVPSTKGLIAHDIFSEDF